LLNSQKKYDNMLWCMEKYMREALREAADAAEKGEVPVGAVIVRNSEIIGRGHNLTESLKDPTAHAEIIAIRQAAKNLGGWRLTESDLYVTAEPCAMCAGAIILSRIRKVFIGTMDPKSGACGSVFNLIQDGRLNHFTETESGIMQKECESMMKDFFKTLRKKKSEEDEL